MMECYPMPLSAAAVRQVPGNLPSVSPLQPVPVDRAPNVSHNIQNSPGSSGAANTGVNQNNPNNNAAAPKESASPSNTALCGTSGSTGTTLCNSSVRTYMQSNLFTMLIVALIVIGLITFFVVRKYRNRNAQAGKS